MEVDGEEYNSWQDAFAVQDSTIEVPQSSTITEGIVISKGELYKICTIKKIGGGHNISIKLTLEFESLYQEPDIESVTISFSSN